MWAEPLSYISACSLKKGVEMMVNLEKEVLMLKWQTDVLFILSLVIDFLFRACSMMLWWMLCWISSRMLPTVTLTVASSLECKSQFWKNILVALIDCVLFSQESDLK